MFYPGEPIEKRCEGCTLFTWGFHDASYLNVCGSSFAFFGEGPYDELARFREFMGHNQPWYSNYRVDDPAISAGGGGHISCYLRQGDRAFLTWETTDRGVEAISSSLQLIDRTVYGRQEAWEDSPEGWPQGPNGAFWRTDDHDTLGWAGRRPNRPTNCPMVPTRRDIGRTAPGTDRSPPWLLRWTDLVTDNQQPHRSFRIALPATCNS